MRIVLRLAAVVFGLSLLAMLAIFDSRPSEVSLSYLYYDAEPSGGQHAMYRQLITQNGAQGVPERLPKWFGSLSPDGNWIAYQEFSEGSGIGFGRMSPDGHNREFLGAVPSRLGIAGWTPDSTGLLIWSDVENGQDELYRLSVLDGTLERLTDGAELGGFHGYSADGSVIFTHLERNEHGEKALYRVRLDGRQQSLVTTYEAHGRLIVSNDGEWIYFQKRRAKSDGSSDQDIFRVRVDGSQQENLTQTPTLELLCNVSPNGKWLLFERRDHTSGEFSIFAKNLVTGENRRLVDDQTGWFSCGTFSPDSQWVYLYDRLEYLYRLRIDETMEPVSPQNLSGPLVKLHYRQTSPDGRWLLVRAINEQSERNLYLMRPNGTGLHTVSTRLTQEGYRGWLALDGNQDGKQTDSGYLLVIGGVSSLAGIGLRRWR